MQFGTLNSGEGTKPVAYGDAVQPILRQAQDDGYVDSVQPILRQAQDDGYGLPNHKS